MKSIKIKSFLCIVGIILVGCVAAPYFTREYELGRPKEVTVGSAMITWEQGVKDEFMTDATRMELLYSGIAQDILYLNYREFAVKKGGNWASGGAYARQPFYQELKYDISKSKQITFKDVEIQVLDANQQKIRFVVVKDGMMRRGR